MKGIILFLLALPAALPAQSPYLTIGAQCGAHASGGCRHYQSPCPEEADAEIRLLLQTDARAAETSWAIRDETLDEIIGEGQGLENLTDYDIHICAFLDHCYTFSIRDSEGNGLEVGAGRYALYWNGSPWREGGVFFTEETASFGGCCTDFDVRLVGGLPCDGSVPAEVTVAVSGGTPPYDYQWSDGSSHNGSWQPEEGVESISVAVSDASGCVGDDELSLSGLSQLSVGIQVEAVSFEGGSDGRATAIVESGIPPYSFLWSTGDITVAASGLPAGNYSVTVTDGSGCTAEAGTIVLGEKPISPVPFGFQLFPNPTTGEVQVVIASSLQGKGSLQVLNSSGQLLYERPISVFQEGQYFTLDMSRRPSGAYWIKVQLGGLQRTEALKLARKP